MRSGSSDTAACDDDRLFRFREQLCGLPHACHLGLRPERRHGAELGFDDRIEVVFVRSEIPLLVAQAQMHRPWRSGSRETKRLPQEIRQTCFIVDLRVELREAVELGEVFQLLIRMAVARRDGRSAGDRDQGNARKKRVLQPRTEVGSADLLRQAQTGSAARSRVAVGHVCCGLFTVRHDPLQTKRLHLLQRLHENRRHEEGVRDAVTFHHFGKEPRTGHLRHFTILLILMSLRATSFDAGTANGP